MGLVEKEKRSVGVLKGGGCCLGRSIHVSKGLETAIWSDQSVFWKDFGGCCLKRSIHVSKGLEAAIWRDQSVFWKDFGGYCLKRSVHVSEGLKAVVWANISPCFERILGAAVWGGSPGFRGDFLVSLFWGEEKCNLTIARKEAIAPLPVGDVAGWGEQGVNGGLHIGFHKKCSCTIMREECFLMNWSWMMQASGMELWSRWLTIFLLMGMPQDFVDGVGNTHVRLLKGWYLNRTKGNTLSKGISFSLLTCNALGTVQSIWSHHTMHHRIDF